MAPVWPEILRAMDQLPEPMELGVIVASDSTLEILPPTSVTSGVVPKRANQALSGLTFEGGCDNVPALSRAWDLAAHSQHSAIIWIHGPQPILMKSVEELRQKWERRPNGPDLYEIEVVGGPNRVIERLEGIGSIHSIPRMGKLEEDLKGWFRKRLPSVNSVHVSRRRMAPASPESIGNSVRTGDHLARLWAFDEFLSLSTRSSKKDTRRAIELASNYRLVTPLTGAVVLETQQQYDDAGLTPAKASEVPTIPEPETWALMGIALLAILCVLRKRRMQWQDMA
jgi:PEP-CTERM motif-containing protein